MSVKAGIDLQLQHLARLATSGYFVGLHIRFAAPLMLFQTYRQDWSDHYTDNGYALRDPMIAWGFSTTGVTRWSEMAVPDTFGILKEAASFGLVYGAAVSCGAISSRTIAGIARSDREFADDELTRIEGIVGSLHDMTEPPESLTLAQIQALRLIAAGDRHAAAAAKLGISESALKARLNAARQRLLARTTAEAIQRAKDYRLL
ncbi:autoinducer binding domain-containing protein [Frigidibacter mobilis]|uniref:Transcriptional regulator n=1 Tax=Frigidibacter mobilis TaxID=1335048 RepID=A0A159Z178_9RHOB|nr:autoinducer binding domain-containing protein [Frigidibacter mobilis]AMY67714.1 transcriptional regulator [Frigidibacter mobilis]